MDDVKKQNTGAANTSDEPAVPTEAVPANASTEQPAVSQEPPMAVAPELSAEEAAAEAQQAVTSGVPAAFDHGQSAANTPAKQHHMPAGSIIVAVAVAVLLIIVAAMAFTQSEKTTAPGDNTQQKQGTGTTTSNQEVTPADIDTVSNDLDKDLNSVNDGTDFAGSDLDDSTLGL